jgi:energy-coupling factor transporter ATP-binding protein EcfA2
MPVVAEKIDLTVFAALKDAYSRKCGGSPSTLQKHLDNRFRDELTLLTEGQKGAQGSHLISDKTLRNFFHSDTPQMKEQYLNYLCNFLLEVNNYQDAIEKFAPKPSTGSEQEIKIQDFPWWEAYKKRIKHKCSEVRIPHMTKPISVADIYVDTECSEEIRERRRKTASQLQAEMEGQTPSQTKRVKADDLLAQSKRLMLWGRGGSGKTTFLKHIALRRIEDNPIQQIPIFIQLRNLIRHRSKIDSLLKIAVQEVGKVFPGHGLDLEKNITDLMRHGKLLFILDGLDEVTKDEQTWIGNLVIDCLDEFPENSSIVSCRPANINYIHSSFHDVEVIEFSESQIEHFVKQWFSKCEEDEKDLDQKFLEKLRENDSISTIAKTPLLLTQLCSIYQAGYDFPLSKSGLLEDALDLYLRKWDSFRRIERPNILKNVSRLRTKGLFAHIAHWSISQKFELLPKEKLEAMITTYIENLPILEKTHEKDHDSVLKNLESCFGILVQENKDQYGFTHKSLQEYLLAQYILNELASEKMTFEKLFQGHLLDPSWRSAILWVAEGLADASEFLKELFQFSLQLSTNKQLNSVLEWLDRITTEAGVSTSSWRACILSYDLETDMHIARSTPDLDNALAQRLAEKTRELNKRYKTQKKRTDRMKLLLDLAVIHALASDKVNLENLDSLDYLARIRRYDPTYGTENIVPKLEEALSIAKDLKLEALTASLDKLLQGIPTVKTGDPWKTWADSLQIVMKDNLDQGYGIVVAPDTVCSLNNLIYVTHLIVDCLLGDIYCSEKDLQRDIFASLLLPADSEKIPEHLLCSE